MQTSLRSNYQYYDHGASNRHLGAHYQPLVTDNTLQQSYGTHLSVVQNEVAYDGADQRLHHQLEATCYASGLERVEPTQPEAAADEHQSSLILHHQYDHYQAIENAVLVAQPVLASSGSHHEEGLYQPQDHQQLLFGQHQIGQPAYSTIYYEPIGYDGENCAIQRVASSGSGQQSSFGENVGANLCELEQPPPRHQQQLEEQQQQPPQDYYHPFDGQQLVEEQQTLQQTLVDQPRQVFDCTNTEEQNQTSNTIYQTLEHTSAHELVRLGEVHDRADILDINCYHHPQLQHQHSQHQQQQQQQPIQDYLSKENFGQNEACFSGLELINNRSQESHSSASSTSSSEESSGSTLTRDEKRIREASIPLTYNEIVDLTIDQFNEQLTKHSLTESQLTLIKDIRRRGKNKVAAQSCRQRKMEQINELQHEVNHLANKRRILTSELNQWNEKHNNLADTYKTIYAIIQEQMRQQT